MQQPLVNLPEVSGTEADAGDLRRGLEGLAEKTAEIRAGDREHKSRSQPPPERVLIKSTRECGGCPDFRCLFC